MGDFLTLSRKWGAMAKVNHLTKHRPTYVQTIQVDEAVSSSDSLPTWVSGEASTSRKTADVELLSGRFPQADDSDSHLKEIT